MFVVVSDLHLGSRHCKSDLLARFLDNLPAEATLILNGDTVDYRRRRMNADHTAVLDRLIAMSATRRVVWLYGNHDEGYRPHNAGALEFAPDLAIGKRLLIQHGSYFDKVMPHHRVFIFAFRVMHYLRVRLGAEAMHVAQYAKKWDRLYRVVRRSVMLNAVAHAKAHGYAAVTCGHTHYAEDLVVDGIRYINTGSWTELPVHYLLIDDTQLRLERYADPRPIQTAAG
jgi:UDP-2,3-diacylglucosamine pyrophosphatase LpxH